MSKRVWIVKKGEGKTVGDIVTLAGGGDRAIDEGRVFLGRKRVVAASEAVYFGDEVTIADPATNDQSAITILVRESDFVAVDKPAGLPTIADHGGRSHALVARAAGSLNIAESRLHPTSRLDREVSGVVLFALTEAAADRLKRARETHTYARRYVAIASRAPALSPSTATELREGTWDAPIGIAPDPRHRAIHGRDATSARTHFAIIADAGPYVLLALAPITGRTHQLRLHASHAAAPLLGDRVYGGPSRITLSSGRVVAIDRIALHAARVTVPTARGAAIAIDSPIPRALRDLWLSLGGVDSAWDTAVSHPLPNA